MSTHSQHVRIDGTRPYVDQVVDMLKKAGERVITGRGAAVSLRGLRMIYTDSHGPDRPADFHEAGLVVTAQLQLEASTLGPTPGWVTDGGIRSVNVESCRVATRKRGGHLNHLLSQAEMTVVVESLVVATGEALHVHLPDLEVHSDDVHWWATVPALMKVGSAFGDGDVIPSAWPPLDLLG